MFEIVILTLLMVAGWFWLDSTRVREAAIALGKDACRRENLILLDYTVAIASIRIKRNRHGRFALRRIYNFEFSDTGNNRLNGTIILLGRELELLDLEKRYLETQQLH